MVKLNKIYTRTGDDGETGLVDGSRAPKHDPRIAAIGDVDEANSRDRRGAAPPGRRRRERGDARPDPERAVRSRRRSRHAGRGFHADRDDAAHRAGADRPAGARDRRDERGARAADAASSCPAAARRRRTPRRARDRAPGRAQRGRGGARASRSIRWRCAISTGCRIISSRSCRVLNDAAARDVLWQPGMTRGG